MHVVTPELDDGVRYGSCGSGLRVSAGTCLKFFAHVKIREGLWAHPGDLAVHVRVGVDPARGDQAAAGVELLVSRDVQAPRARAIADGDDQAVLDGDVALEGRVVRAVDQRAVADDHIGGHGHGCGLLDVEREEFAQLCSPPTRHWNV